MRLLLIWILNALALLAVGNFVPGIHLDSFWYGVLGAALYSVFSWALSAAAAQIMRPHNE